MSVPLKTPHAALSWFLHSSFVWMSWLKRKCFAGYKEDVAGKKWRKVDSTDKILRTGWYTAGKRAGHVWRGAITCPPGPGRPTGVSRGRVDGRGRCLPRRAKANSSYCCLSLRCSAVRVRHDTCLHFELAECRGPNVKPTLGRHLAFPEIALQYTLFNNNTPHSEQRWTVLIRQLLHTFQWQRATQWPTLNCFNQTTVHAQSRASSLFNYQVNVVI